LSYRPTGTANHKRQTENVKFLFSVCLFLFALLSRFFVRRVLRAKPAEFFELDAAGVLLLILRRRIVAALAIAAFEGNDFSHFLFLNFELTARFDLESS